ncbi:hypothetical protein BDA96_03G166100 [Sorghum bicolor]|uniref:IBB domain-containing protein n=2 Tax=Sorghum bicolor TaxID=4558 RepID=A0A921UQ57_SORBI|nr:hypothetical protein BDA96_03G166100 [Sorghum bicolor]KXG32451.1 hypothetical protein SORBI_3003G157100 [Sorghum bicolor]
MSLRPSEQTELRRSSFKASVSVADGLRRRVSAMDSIRKESRGSALRRKRCSEVAPHAQSQPPALEKKLTNLTQWAAGLYSDDSSMQFEAAREFRKLLSIGLFKEDLKEQVIQGAEVVKSMALFFHNQDLQARAHDDLQMVPIAG